MKQLYLSLFFVLCILFAYGQENVIKLENDTVYYEADYEYRAAYEAESFIESFVFYQAALRAYKKNDLIVAKASISKAIKLNKDEESFQMLKAWVESKIGNYKKAIKITTKLIETRSDFSEAHYCRALNYYFMQQYTNANIGFSYLIEQNNKDVQAYFGRAETKMKVNDIQGAIADYSAALAIRPSFYEAYKNRGIAYSKLYDYRRAIIDFNQALTVKKEDGELYYYRGVCYLRSNDVPNACKNFELAVKFNYRPAAEYFTKNCKF